MLILGLLLLGVGVLIILAGVFTAELSGGQLQVVGIELSPLALFLLGVAAGVAILWGLTITRFGAKRELRQRKEEKRIDHLSEQLDRADERRHRDGDDDPDRTYS